VMVFGFRLRLDTSRPILYQPISGFIGDAIRGSSGPWVVCC
jgi:hypothetical protein